MTALENRLLVNYRVKKLRSARPNSRWAALPQTCIEQV